MRRTMGHNEQLGPSCYKWSELTVIISGSENI